MVLMKSPPTHVAELKDGKVTTFDISPADVGLSEAKPADLKGGTPQENAEALRALLRGEEGAYRDIVVINAAASLLVANKVGDLKAGAAQAQAAIDDGKALEVLEDLINITNQPVGDDMDEEVGG